MNSKRLALAIVAVFAGVWVTDFLIHGVWLANAYKETMGLWRPEAEMRSHMGWLLLGQFLWAATFVLVWSKGFPATASLGGACLFGLTMGVFFQASTLVAYAVQPLPGHLALKWFVSSVAQGGAHGCDRFLCLQTQGAVVRAAHPNSRDAATPKCTVSALARPVAEAPHEHGVGH
jgi:hypothetical protein